MSGLSGIGLLTSFGAGVVSFLSPCVLPLVPGYVSYVAGDALTASKEAPGRVAVLRLSLCFVLGFSTVFVILGASATSLGRLLLAYRYEANLVGGAVVILFGLFMVGLANLSWLQREFRLHLDLTGGRPIAAYVIGHRAQEGARKLYQIITDKRASDHTGSIGEAAIADASLAPAAPGDTLTRDDVMAEWRTAP